MKPTVFTYASFTEGSNLPVDDEVPDEIKAKRARQDEADKLASIEHAKKILAKDLTKRNLSKFTTILPEDRKMLQEACSDPKNQEMFNATRKKFPNDPTFKRLFYRMIDGGESEDLRNIEERVFKSILPTIEKNFSKKFDGSKEMNNSCDKKISVTIRKSFYCYENARSRKDQQYFDFS